MTRAYFSARQIARHRAKADSAMPESAVFKLRDGTQQGSAVQCRVSPHEIRPQEVTAGDRTTGTTLWDIAFPAGTVVRDFWRIFVTFASGETAQYHVKGPLGPLTYETERIVVCEKVAV